MAGQPHSKSKEESSSPDLPKQLTAAASAAEIASRDEHGHAGLPSAPDKLPMGSSRHQLLSSALRSGSSSSSTYNQLMRRPMHQLPSPALRSGSSSSSMETQLMRDLMHQLPSPAICSGRSSSGPNSRRFPIFGGIQDWHPGVHLVMMAGSFLPRLSQRSTHLLRPLQPQPAKAALEARCNGFNP